MWRFSADRDPIFLHSTYPGIGAGGLFEGACGVAREQNESGGTSRCLDTRQIAE